MISVDISKLKSELEKFHKETVRKLEGMVELFVYNVTFSAIENTPFGDDDAYAKLYNHPARLAITKNARAGLAKGGWVIEMNKPYTSQWFMQADNEVAENVKWAADQRSQNYKLGDTVYITNNVPYVANDGWVYETYKNGNPVKSLESGASSQAPQGIMKPTVDSIMNVYSLNLKQYYEGS